MIQDKKKKPVVQYISQFRTELMGFCIIWIYLFHASVQFTGSPLLLPLSKFKDIGYAGVDVFLFLSGFGLMTGMIKKNYDTLAFYKKRMLRILPAYWIATVTSFICMGIQDKTIAPSEIFLKLTTLWFWVGKDRFLWFIPSILALYCIFPFFYRAHAHAKRKRLFVFLCVTASILLTQLLRFEFEYLVIFLSRVPIFLFGAHIAYEMHQGTIPNIPIGWYAVSTMIILAISALLSKFCPHEFMRSTGLTWYRYSLLAFPFLVTLAYIFKKINNSNTLISSSMNSSFHFLGTLSLEIYLVHENIVFALGPNLWNRIANNNPTLQSINTGRIAEYTLYFGITIIAAWLLRYGADAVARNLGRGKRIKATQ